MHFPDPILKDCHRRTPRPTPSRLDAPSSAGCNLTLPDVDQQATKLKIGQSYGTSG